MNIKKAKEQIKGAIKAYFTKDSIQNLQQTIIVLNLLANLAVKNIFSITKNYCFMKGSRILYAG